MHILQIIKDWNVPIFFGGIIAFIVLFFIFPFRKIAAILLPVASIYIVANIPQHSWIIAVLLGIWLLNLLGGYQAFAFSKTDILLNKWVNKALIFISAVIGGLLVFYMEKAKPINNIGAVVIYLLYFVVWSIVVHYIFKSLIKYIISPLLRDKGMEKTATLQNYYAIQSRRHVSYYIVFADYPEIYQVDYIQFIRFKKHVGTVYSYIKYQCVFGVHFIKKVRMENDMVQELSSWEVERKKNPSRSKGVLLLWGILMLFVVFTIILVIVEINR